MAFFDNFKVIKKKTQYSLMYKDNLLASIKPSVLGQLVKDYATKKFLKELAGLAPTKDIDSDIKNRALVLSRIYTEKKRNYHKNKNIRMIDSNSKEFAKFVKAVGIINRHKVTPKFFLNSQIKGLGFVNGGNGVFPSPAQLCSASAEDRLIKIMHEDGLCDGPSDFSRIELSYSDKNTPLMENPKFVAIYEKIKDESATRREAAYIEDCMIARNGRVTKTVRDYIEKFED